MTRRVPSSTRRFLLPVWRAITALFIVSGSITGVFGEGGPVGAIRGLVRDSDSSAPLSKARVAVLELPLGGFSGEDGSFLIEHVPPGSYTLSITREGYQRQILPAVSVNGGRITEVKADLVQEVVDLDELVVSGADITDASTSGALEIRATAASVQDTISSELMSRSAASDVGGALKRVVGASVVEGKYAVVRGLSDRYTGTTLNGVRIPSADPRRRAVQVDLFPTGTIESVTVTKTFTPDLEGDFTGGGIDIKTKAIPAGRTLSINWTSEYNDQATGNPDVLTYQGGGVDPLARADSDRILPGIAEQTQPQFPATFTALPRPIPATETESAGDYDRLTRSFTPVMGVSRTTPAWNQGFTLLGGNRLELGGGKVLGLMGGLTQTHKHDFYLNGENNTAGVSDPQQGIAVRRQRSDTVGSEESLVGLTGSAVLQISANQSVGFRYLKNQSAEDAARLQVDSQASPLLEQNQSLHYVEREVESEQLHGSHSLGGATEETGSGPLLEWTLAHNSTMQDEPDVRYFRNVFDLTNLSGSMNFNGGSTDAQNTRRIFRTIEERNDQLMADYALPLPVWGERSGRLKSGLYIDRTDRDYEQHSYSYTFPTQVASRTGTTVDPIVAVNKAKAFFQAQSPDQLWTDVFTDPDRMGLAGNNPKVPNQLLWSIYPLNEDVNYTGDQSINALYTMADLPLSERWRMIAGARLESTSISIVPTNESFGKVTRIEITETGDRAVNPNVPQEEAEADIDDKTWLPSVGFIFEARPGENIRLSWSHTLARPTFRELAPVATEEFIFGDEFMGNPDLTLSKITNYDVRWEMFPRSGDVLAASLFYKDISQPIEVISFAAGGRSFLQPVNFEHGKALGMELEARASLGAWVPRLQGLSAGANFTFLHSAVDVPEDEQISLASFGLDQETTPLQGQPQYVVNADMMYDLQRLGLVAGVFYNKVGEMLLSGAARGTDDGNPDVYLLPYATLDFKVTKTFRNGLSASLIGKNLTRSVSRSVYRKPDGDETPKTVHVTPALFGVSVGWSW